MGSFALAQKNAKARHQAGLSFARGQILLADCSVIGQCDEHVTGKQKTVTD